MPSIRDWSDIRERRVGPGWYGRCSKLTGSGSTPPFCWPDAVVQALGAIADREAWPADDQLENLRGAYPGAALSLWRFERRGYKHRATRSIRPVS
jgi:hypothetical protein